MKTFVWLALFGLAFLYIAVVEMLDWIGRLDLIEQKWPKVWSAIMNRRVRLALLIVLCILVGKDVSERWNDSDPQPIVVETPLPPAPIIQVLSPAVPAALPLPAAPIPQVVINPIVSTTDPGMQSLVDEVRNTLIEVDKLERDWVAMKSGIYAEYIRGLGSKGLIADPF